MKITKRRLQNLIKESIEKLLLEDVADKAAIAGGLDTDNPRIEDLRIASGKPYKLQKPDLVWLARYFASPEGSASEEPIADIASTIVLFNRSKMLISKIKMPTDINEYNNPGDLRLVLSRTKGKVTGIDLEREMDYLGKYGDWHVTMPHTREAACSLGEGTTWCTAIANKGNNLFYNYVMGGSDRGMGNIILYHIIHDDVYLKSADSRAPTNSKISIGTTDGTIYFPEQGRGYGSITVNADNKGVSKRDFEKIVGKTISDQIINAIKDSTLKTQGLHPAKKKIDNMLTDVDLLKQELRGKSIDAKASTIDLIQSHAEELTRKNRMNQSDQGILSKDVKGLDNEGMSKETFDFIKNFYEDVNNQNLYFNYLIKSTIDDIKDAYKKGLVYDLEDVFTNNETTLFPLSEEGFLSRTLESFILQQGKLDIPTDTHPEDQIYKKQIEIIDSFLEELYEAGFDISKSFLNNVRSGSSFAEKVFLHADDIIIIDKRQPTEIN